MKGTQFHFQRRTRGFTLLEVLAALVIFSVGVVGILVNLRDTMGAQQRVQINARAASLAQNIMEEIRLSGSSTLGEDSGDFKGDDKNFSWRSKTESTGTPQLRQVTVTVLWKDGAREQNYQIATMMVSSE